MHVTNGKTLGLGLVVKLSLVLSLLVTWPKVTCEETNGIFIKYHIHILNALTDPNSKLFMHCKSGDSDKGERTLVPGEEYTWGTTVNIFTTTLYFCFVRWEGVKEQYFVAFKAKRDDHRCGGPMSACFWRVKTDGISFSSDNVTWVNEYPW